MIRLKIEVSNFRTTVPVKVHLQCMLRDVLTVEGLLLFAMRLKRGVYGTPTPNSGGTRTPILSESSGNALAPGPPLHGREKNYTDIECEKIF